MNKILIIDTSTEACSVALEADGELYQEYQVAPRQHGELVLPMVDSVLKQVDVKLNELDCIGYGQGPGAFTGLRICVSIVQGLAFGANVPVIGCSSLQAMAQQALIQGHSDVLSAIDARMGEVYWGQYREHNGLMTLVGEEAVLNPENVTISAERQSSSHAVETRFQAVGTGWETYSEELIGAVDAEVAIEVQASFPSAAQMLPWVKQQLVLGNAVAAELAQPIYLRNNVAKKKAEQGKPQSKT